MNKKDETAIQITELIKSGKNTQDSIDTIFKLIYNPIRKLSAKEKKELAREMSKSLKLWEKDRERWMKSIERRVVKLETTESGNRDDIKKLKDTIKLLQDQIFTMVKPGVDLIGKELNK